MPARRAGSALLSRERFAATGEEWRQRRVRAALDASGVRNVSNRDPNRLESGRVADARERLTRRPDAAREEHRRAASRTSPLAGESLSAGPAGASELTPLTFPSSTRRTGVRDSASRPGRDTQPGRSAARAPGLPARDGAAGFPSETLGFAPVLFYRRDGSTFDDPAEASRMFADIAYRRVAYTEGDGWSVSTVFLVVPHPPFWDGHPSLYETLASDHETDRIDRYPNEIAALAGHDQAVAAMTADHATSSEERR